MPCLQTQVSYGKFSQKFKVDCTEHHVKFFPSKRTLSEEGMFGVEQVEAL
jgi:hypothetical protein